MNINLGELYQEIAAKLRDAEQKAAELRGQLQLIERLMQQAQRPALSGDPLDEGEES